jgi:flavin-dependent dehydrogenase
MRRNRSFADELGRLPADRGERPQLEDGSSVAVVGGGPAGSFFSYFLLKLADVAGVDVKVDLYEPRDYTCAGAGSCNHCGGIISESLVQLLATEGINLPPTVVRRGLDSYVLHMDVGSVRIETPLQEKRIAAAYRGAGPKGSSGLEAGSFDRYLQQLAVGEGANLIPRRVSDLTWVDGRPVVTARNEEPRTYDLVVGAVGVNSAALKLFEKLDFGYEPPGTTKTFICEFLLGEQTILEHMGPSMHVFLLDMPRVEFAAFIPKGDYLTLCLLGDSIDKKLVQSFLDQPEVQGALPPNVDLALPNCNCAPKINVRRAIRPFRDRMVLIGDSGVARLYKDGIGSAYRTAKAAATTAIFQGISEEDFRSHYWKACRVINNDNTIGEGMFRFTRLIQKLPFARRGVLRMVSGEQQVEGTRRPMSTVVWDLFTGSAPYREVFVRTIKPAFVGRLLWNLAAGVVPKQPRKV